MSELFLKQYIKDYSDLILPEAGLINTLMQVKDALVTASENGKKVIIVGNGGSAAMASHVSVDLTKNAGIRSINFNESDLITCFANDYGYEHWVEKAVEFYGNKGDVFIGISSSGSSENILNGCHAAQKNNFAKVITFSGMEAKNPLRQLGDINIWVNSMSYNHIENIHQFWLLAIVDVIIGKAVYSLNPDAS